MALASYQIAALVLFICCMVVGIWAVTELILRRDEWPIRGRYPFLLIVSSATQTLIFLEVLFAQFTALTELITGSILGWFGPCKTSRVSSNTASHSPSHSLVSC